MVLQWRRPLRPSLPPSLPLLCPSFALSTLSPPPRVCRDSTDANLLITLSPDWGRREQNLGFFSGPSTSGSESSGNATWNDQRAPPHRPICQDMRGRFPPNHRRNSFTKKPATALSFSSFAPARSSRRLDVCGQCDVSRPGHVRSGKMLPVPPLVLLLEHGISFCCILTETAY